MNHVSFVPTMCGHKIPVHVRPMTAVDARYWHHVVQPLIRNIPSRADCDWNWRLHRAGATLTAEALGQQPRAFVLEPDSTALSAICPIVMLILVQAYPAIHEHQSRSVFVWFISPAPTQFFTQELHLPQTMTPPRTKLMAIGMDMAVTHSFACGLSGYVGLHAAEEGGDELLSWYEIDGRMKRLAKTEPLPMGVRRLQGNDGRYFYHTSDTATKVREEMSELRGNET